MKQTGILYDSLPMMRLGARDDTEEVVIAPDFSISAYMLEEYMTLATAHIAIPTSAPEASKLEEFPPLLRKRVKVVDDGEEKDSVARLLHPIRTELGVTEKGDDRRLRFPKTIPHEIQLSVRVAHRALSQLAVGFNHGLQVGLYPESVGAAIKLLRGHLRDNNGRAILAQIEGLLAVYQDVTFDSPRPPTAAPAQLISLFDRLLNDPNYIEMSAAVAELGNPITRKVTLSRIRDCGRKLLTNGIVTKGWDYVGKAVKAWTGAPLPEADTLLTIVSGKQFPVLVDLRQARKRAVLSWQETMEERSPISASGDEYEGISWIVPGTPSENWDGGDVFSFSLGTVAQLKDTLETFAQQKSGHVRK